MRVIQTLVITCLPLTVAGCETMEENPEASGAIIGGLAGAGVGAVAGGEDHRAEGALIGGAVGAGGGYIVGDQIDKKNDRDDREDRQRERARRERDYEYERAREAGYSDRFYDREYDD